MWIAAALFAGILPPDCARAGDTLSTKEKAALLEEAKLAQDAMNRGDLEAMMKYEHPAVFKLAGGKDEFEKQAKASLEMLKTLGVKYVKTDFGDPTDTYDAGDNIVCFLPRTSLLDTNGKKVKSQGYWLAARTKGDTVWRFVDGAGIEANKDLLWMMFPDLPKDIHLPEWKQEVVE